jgi:hypothetical protein
MRRLTYTWECAWQMHIRIVEDQSDVEVSFFMPDGQVRVQTRGWATIYIYIYIYIMIHNIYNIISFTTSFILVRGV